MTAFNEDFDKEFEKLAKEKGFVDKREFTILSQALLDIKGWKIFGKWKDKDTTKKGLLAILEED